MAQAFILIYGARSDEVVRFQFNPKTAIRSLGERLAQLRLRGNFYLAKQLQIFNKIITNTAPCQISELTKIGDSFTLNPMFKKIPIPPSFSLTEKGETYLLLRNDYKDALLHQGIGDLETFFKNHLPTTIYLNGRTPHPSIPIQGGMRIVFRKYSHGGFLRVFNRSLYLFGARSFKELSLTEEIRSLGIPTIQPIGAIHQIVFGPFYRAYLLSLEIPHAKNLIQYFQKNGSKLSRESLLHKRKTIRASGLLLRQFHQRGFYHRDLQIKNLLVAGDQVLIIDFDRSYRKKALSVRERVKNLLRLNRSVEKWKRSGLPITRTDRWRFLMAYAGGDQEIRKAIRKALRTFSIGLFFHRTAWAMKIWFGVKSS